MPPEVEQGRGPEVPIRHARLDRPAVVRFGSLPFLVIPEPHHRIDPRYYTTMPGVHFLGVRGMGTHARFDSITTRIGTSDNNQLTLDGEGVTPSHAQIQRDTEGWQIDGLDGDTFVEPVAEIPVIGEPVALTRDTWRLIPSKDATISVGRKKVRLHAVGREGTRGESNVYIGKEKKAHLPLYTPMQIGSSYDNDVEIAGFDRRHLTVMATEEGYLILSRSERETNVEVPVPEPAQPRRVIVPAEIEPRLRAARFVETASSSLRSPRHPNEDRVINRWGRYLGIIDGVSDPEVPEGAEAAQIIADESVIGLEELSPEPVSSASDAAQIAADETEIGLSDISWGINPTVGAVREAIDTIWTQAASRMNEQMAATGVVGYLTKDGEDTVFEGAISGTGKAQVIREIDGQVTIETITLDESGIYEGLSEADARALMDEMDHVTTQADVDGLNARGNLWNRRHVLARGKYISEETTTPRHFSHKVRPGDRYILLSSDGLDALTPEQKAEIVGGHGTVNEKANSLTSAAQAVKGIRETNDDISVVLGELAQ